jgi:uncharacterized protein YgiM (DUF1202 family)
MAGHWIGLRRHGRPGLRLADVAVVFGLTLVVASAALAQATSEYPRTLPNTTITSDTGDSRSSSTGDNASDTEAAPPAGMAPAPEHVAPRGNHPHPAHHTKRPAPSYAAEVEPAHAMLKLNADAWVHAEPTISSSTLERVNSGKFVDVTGSTHYYVQVRLKSGTTGYIPMSAMELTRPQDKVLRLSTDTGVVSQPNRYGRKLAEVHQGHDVHVVGTALNYLKIQMKSGLQGYIPMTAVE